MAITAIKRDFIGYPNIVRIESTDDLATITAVDYLVTQNDVIKLINNGDFEWVDSDMVLISYLDGKGFFTHDTVNNTFVSVVNNSHAEAGTNYTVIPITADEFNGMYADPVLLLPAQGFNTLTVLISSKIVMTHNFNLYQDGGNVAIQYTDTANGGGTLASTTVANTLFNVSNSAILQFNPSSVSIPFTAANQALFLSNASAAFTAGDSPMVCHLWWRTITI